MISLKNVSVTLQNNPILKNIDVRVEQGDFIVVVGHNGAGKTTLFNVISGKIMPTNGQVTLDGSDVQKLTGQERARFISQLYQKPQYNSVADMTIKENLALSNMRNFAPCFKKGMNYFFKESTRLLEEAYPNVCTLLDTKMKYLSGGQQQLIAFIMATLHTPKLLLLDEPTAALDPKASTDLLVSVKKIVSQKNIATIMITHDPYLALSLGNKIWVLDQGRIAKIIDKTKGDLINPNDLIGSINYDSLKN